MNDEYLKAIYQYKARILDSKARLEHATGLAVQQRLFVLWCGMQGLPIVDLVQVSNRIFDHIGKMSECLTDMEHRIDFLCDVIESEEDSSASDTDSGSNSDDLMSSIKQILAIDLNEAYQSGDSERYEELLSIIKSKGVKVLRNDKGDHRVEFI